MAYDDSRIVERPSRTTGTKHEIWLTVPGARLAERLHHRSTGRTARLSQRDTCRGGRCVYAQAGADAPAFSYPVSLTVTAYFTGRRQDCSNITGKLYEDGLVACGILPDDTPKYVGSYTTRSRKSETGSDYVVIEIDDGVEAVCLT